MDEKESRIINERIATKIRGKLSERKIKRYTVGDWLNVSEMTISMKLNGKSPFTVGEFSIIAAMLCLSASEILDVLEWKG